MNDSEIIKALECCYVLHQCEDCPCDYDTNGKTLCNEVGANILGLIKRQQAEIDRLNIDLMAMRGAANSYKAHYEDLKSENLETIKILKTAKSEAVREFAEKLKEYCDEIANQEWNKRTLPVSWADAYKDFIDDIDRLLEEMGCNDG